MKEFFIIAIVHFLGTISPGPGLIGITRYTIKNGIKNAWKYSFGIAISQAIYIFLSLFGIIQIALHIAIISKIFSFCSGLYLLYLGYMLIKSQPIITFDSTNERPINNPFNAGFFITLYNPNVPIFYSSVLSNFINKNSSIDFLLFITIYMTVATFIIFYIIALIFNKFRNKIVIYVMYIEKIFGLCLWYFGGKLLFQVFT